MKTLTITLLIALATLFSCKNSSKAMDSDNITPTNSKPSSPVADKDIVYDVILSFISKASGIDRPLRAKIDAVLVASNKKYKTSLKPDITTWGREGELDYNFITKNLSTKQKKELEVQLKEAIGSSDVVHVIYNSVNVHKR